MELLGAKSLCVNEVIVNDYFWSFRIIPSYFIDWFHVTPSDSEWLQVTPLTPSDSEWLHWL